jgi:hypothetical protein
MPTIEAKDTHPTGWFTFVVGSIREETSRFGACLKIPLVSDEGEVEPMFSTTYSRGSKLGKFAAAAIGCEWEELPKPLNTDLLEGCNIIGRVILNENGYPTVEEFKPFDPFVM